MEGIQQRVETWMREQQEKILNASSSWDPLQRRVMNHNEPQPFWLPTVTHNPTTTTTHNTATTTTHKPF